MLVNLFTAAMPAKRGETVTPSLKARPSNVFFGAREQDATTEPLPGLGDHPMAWWPLYQREVAKLFRRINILGEALMHAIPAAGWEDGIPREVIEAIQSRVGLTSAEILPTLSPEESEAALAARKATFAPIARAIDKLRAELSGPASKLDEELDEFKTSLEKTVITA